MKHSEFNLTEFLENFSISRISSLLHQARPKQNYLYIICIFGELFLSELESNVIRLVVNLL